MLRKLRDFVPRVEKAARSKGQWPAGARVSLGAAVGDGSDPATVELTALLYTDQSLDNQPNCIVHAPYARAQLDREGNLSQWQSLRPPDEKRVLGERFAEPATRMTAVELLSFLDGYFRLLTDENSPLHVPWGEVSQDRRNDLRKLFTTFVERPFLPIYVEHCTPYLQLIGVL